MPLLHPNMKGLGSAALVPPTLSASAATSSSSDAPSTSSAPQPDAPQIQSATVSGQSYFDTEWVAYPTGGPPAISLSLFLGYAQSVGAAGKLLLDRHGLPSPAQVALSWLTPEAPGVSDKAWVVPPGVAPAEGNLSLPEWGNHTQHGVPHPASADIEGAACAATPSAAATSTPLLILLVLSITILIMDYHRCCGFDLNLFCCSLMGRETSAAPIRTERLPEPDKDATGPSSAPAAKPEKADTTTAADGAEGAEGEEVDDGPKEIDTAGVLIIAFTVVPALVGDLYFTMLAPFLPGVCHQRGLSNAIVGLIFACQPLGSIFIAPVVPWMLRQPWGDPYWLLRTATSIACIAVATQGMLGLVPLDSILLHTMVFVPVMLICRVAQGVCVTIMEVSNSSISLMLLPKKHVGMAQGIIMATRVLGVILGPVIGGFLYQAGCWSMPFIVGGYLELTAIFCLMAGLGQRAPEKVKPGPDAMSTWELAQIPDTWFIALPMFMVCMETSLMEPAWQPFLGRRPFSLAPAEIGGFLNNAVIVYMIFLVVAGMCVNTLGPAVQYLFGAILSGVGLFFIGPSPLLNGAVPQNRGIVLMGAMVSYTGVAFFVPAIIPLCLEVFSRAGFGQKQVAGVCSSLMTLIICSANFIGPPLGGVLIDQLGGVPLTTTCYSFGVLIVSLIAIAPLCKYAKRLDAECVERFKGAKDVAEGLPGAEPEKSV